MNNFFLKQTCIDTFLSDEKLLMQFCLLGDVRFATAQNWFKTNNEQLTNIKHLVIMCHLLGKEKNKVFDLVEEK